MLKIILFVKRKPGLTMEEFKTYYETTHAPLAKRSLPRLGRYERNYITAIPGMGEPPFDCVTEFYFEDEKAWQETQVWARGEGAEILARDEANFMDRSSMVSVLADEARSSEVSGG